MRDDRTGSGSGNGGDSIVRNMTSKVAKRNGFRGTNGGLSGGGQLTAVIAMFAALAGWMFSLEQRKADRGLATDRWTKTQQIEYAKYIDKRIDDVVSHLDKRMDDAVDRNDSRIDDLRDRFSRFQQRLERSREK